jgi:hypothetical protein
MSTPDFLLAGSSEELRRWPVVAQSVGVLWCYESLNDSNCDICKSACHRQIGCGICNGSLVLLIVPIDSAPGFDNSSYACVTLITCSKRSMRSCQPSNDSIRSLVDQFVSAFHGNISCFESETNEAGIRWIPFVTA